MRKEKIKVLIIDDSALVRKILTKGLSEDAGIEVIGAAKDVFEGRNMMVMSKPDVITLDIEMPKMDGLEFLRRFMPQYPVPTVVVSSLSQKGKRITLEAIEAGAVDYVAKPTSDIASGLESMMQELRTKVKIASTANVAFWKNRKFNPRNPNLRRDSITALSETTDKVIAIGASTGGTEAITRVVTELPPQTPGIIITQHMPKVFTKTFADRLNELSLMTVKEAEDGDKVYKGRILIAPGDFHLTIARSGGYYYVKLDTSEKVNGHRPSVDVMFNSVAKYCGANAYGIILTGMGADGAKGMMRMKKEGAKTIGQDEATSVVYGMPKIAYQLGAVDYQLPLDRIANKLNSLIQRDTANL